MREGLKLPINSVMAMFLLLLLLVPALYFAKPLLLPIVLSSFIALLFSPLINYFENKGVPRSGIVIVLLGLLVSASALGLSAISEPAKQWWAELPSIVKNVSQEVNEVTKASSEQMDTPLDLGETMNINEMSNSTVLSLLKTVATTTPSILTQAMIMLFMVYFMLNNGRSLFRKSVSHLRGFSKQRQAVELVQALQKDLSRYIASITLVNLGLGLSVGLVFFALGLEDPFLWGAFAGVMNFAPYLGPVISMGSFAFVAYLQHDSVSFMVTVVSAYLLLNLIESQFVTPTLLGKRFNLNPLVIFIWLVFWGWLWGGMGLLIGVPLLVSLNILMSRLVFCSTKQGNVNQQQELDKSLYW